ncbi:hypothetical protein GCM10027446_07020 [Angustibacter peucedani]
MTALLVMLGGLVGAPLRYVVDQVLTARRPGLFPLGTFAVNTTGSLVLGVVAGAVSAGAPTWLATLVGTGFCGALTTFSTFSFETVRLAEEGDWTTALANAAGSLLLGLAACAGGFALAAALG